MDGDINGRRAFFDGTAPSMKEEFSFLRRHTRTAHLLTFGTPLDESRCPPLPGGSPAHSSRTPTGVVGRSVRHPNPPPKTLQERARVLWRPFALLPSRALGAARAGRPPRTMRCAVTPTSRRVPGEGAMGGGREEGGEEARARERRGGEEGEGRALGGWPASPPGEGKGRAPSVPFPPLGRAAYPVKASRPVPPRPPSNGRHSPPDGRAHFSNVHSERSNACSAHSHCTSLLTTLFACKQLACVLRAACVKELSLFLLTLGKKVGSRFVLFASFF